MTEDTFDGTKQTQAGVPEAGRTTLVHKSGEEGSILVDLYTGDIKTSLDQRPGWAEGLANAMTGERASWYQKRLGRDITADNLLFPEAMAFEDLSWVVIKFGDGEELQDFELSFDEEHRMDVLAGYLGMSREEDVHYAGKVLAEVEIGMDRARTDEEVKLLQDEQRDIEAGKFASHG